MDWLERSEDECIGKGSFLIGWCPEASLKCICPLPCRTHIFYVFIIGAESDMMESIQKPTNPAILFHSFCRIKFNELSLVMVCVQRIGLFCAPSHT
jgi:hypothetical protein